MTCMFHQRKRYNNISRQTEASKENKAFMIKKCNRKTDRQKYTNIHIKERERKKANITEAKQREIETEKQTITDNIAKKQIEESEGKKLLKYRQTINP